jgi:ABC-2 type transport system ATP-binding protein
VDDVDAIAVHEVRKRYDSVQALDGVTFSVRDGEIFGLLGPNGAGKSTAVRVLTTLTHPDAGHALVAGHDVVRHPGRVRRAIGYVAQESGVDLQATGRENLMLQGRLHGLGGVRLRQRVDELLELSGLREAANRLARSYSGGMKRRLDIATGLVHRPRVLFLDEPTAGLDPEARAAMWIEVERLARQESLTILLTTHYLGEVDQLAERVAIVSRGKVVAEGATAELKANLRGELVTVELAGGDRRVEEAASAVRSLKSASEVAFDGNLLRARVASGAQAIPAILSTLDRRGFSVASVNTARPSLDDVYLHYTGRDFATENEAAKQ